MLFITFVVTGAYISGTFHPNDYVVGQIEDEVHRKEMKVVEALGLKEAEFEYNDKITFINATSKCSSNFYHYCNGRDRKCVGHQQVCH